MSDPTHHHPITQDQVDAQGRLPLKGRFHHIIHREINSSKNTCGAVPCPSRMPDANLTIVVLGGETPYGSHLVRGLTNPAYSLAWNVRVVETAVVQQCRDVASWVEVLRGAHTVISAECCIMQRDGRYVDTSDDSSWQQLIEACEKGGVKRFLPSPFEWDLQLARPAKKNEPEPPEPIRRATERQQLLTQQKELDWTLISVGVLTEQLFSPLAGVDVEAGVVREPAGLGWQTIITTTTLDDVARMLPEILLSSKSSKAKVRLCSATLTYEKVAKILEETTGKSVQRVNGSVSSAEQEAGYHPATNDASNAFNLLLSASEGLWWTKGNSWNAGHIPHVLTTPVRQWAQQHIKTGNTPLGPDFQANLHTTHTGLAPFPPTPAQLYFSVAS